LSDFRKLFSGIELLESVSPIKVTIATVDK